MGELFFHWFIPHHSNNHRARALHLDALLFYVIVFAVLHVGIQFVYKARPDVLGYATDIRIEQLLADTNLKRTQIGLQPLKLNSDLSGAAAKKASDMFAKNYWAHQSPDGKTPWDFILSTDYRYAIAGENLAKNFSTSGAVVDAWMASPSHKENIVKPQYRDIGFAVVNGVLNGEETTLVVQMFGATAAELASGLPEKMPVLPSPVAEGSAKQPVSAVIIPPSASNTDVMGQTGITDLLSGVTKRPLIDLTSLTRIIGSFIVGTIMVLLLVDAWIVARKKVVRVVGYNMSHIMFLAALLFAINMIVRGSVL